MWSRDAEKYRFDIDGKSGIYQDTGFNQWKRMESQKFQRYAYKPLFNNPYGTSINFPLTRWIQTFIKCFGYWEHALEKAGMGSWGASCPDAWFTEDEKMVAMRNATEAAIKKIAAGTSSDEIVHAMDLFPTLAKIAGGQVPSDRIIDGIDVSNFLLGKTQKSGRDGFIVYMGDDIFGVKWRNWKLHFKEQNTWNAVLRTYTMPRVYNLMNDPQERDNVLFPHTWVPKAALPQLEEHVASLKKYPPIPTGAPDPYEPPK